MQRPTASHFRLHDRPAIRAVALWTAALLVTCHTCSAQNLTLEPASAPDTAAGADPPAAHSRSETPKGITGDWNGLRTKAADQGLTLEGYVMLDVSRNFQGGVSTQATPVRYLLDIGAALDTEKAFHWSGGTVWLEFASHDGANGNAVLTGSTLDFDNMEASSFVQIYQFWYQQTLDDERFRVKVGKIDANIDFSAIEHAKEFLNATMAYSLAMFPLPTYPDPAPGALAFFHPVEHLYIGGGAFYANRHDTFLEFSGHPSRGQGAEGGMFYIAELGGDWTLGQTPGRAGVGGWVHSGAFQSFTGEEVRGTGGWYAFADQTLWRDPDAAGLRDVGLFVNAGAADPQVSAVAWQAGGGVAVTGLVPGRPEDVAGVGFTWVQTGGETRSVRLDEHYVEGFYKVLLTRWASAKADLQYIHHPSADLRDALVATLRLELDF